MWKLRLTEVRAHIWTKILAKTLLLCSSTVCPTFHWPSLPGSSKHLPLNISDTEQQHLVPAQEFIPPRRSPDEFPVFCSRTRAVLLLLQLLIWKDCENRCSFNRRKRKCHFNCSILPKRWSKTLTRLMLPPSCLIVTSVCVYREGKGRGSEDQSSEESKTNIWTEAHMDPVASWSQLAPAHQSQLYISLPSFKRGLASRMKIGKHS